MQEAIEIFKERIAQLERFKEITYEQIGKEPCQKTRGKLRFAKQNYELAQELLLLVSQAPKFLN